MPRSVLPLRRIVRMYGRGEGFAAVADYPLEEYAAWSELLMVTIPYGTEQISERQVLLRLGERAWSRAVGTSLSAAHPTHCQLLIDVLEGRWRRARQLAEQGQSAPRNNQYLGVMVRLGILARAQGEPNLAWEQVFKFLPDGPDTEPGDSYFPHAHAAQRLAADLALDASDLDLAQRWIDAHGCWQEWSGALLWKPHHQVLWARYHRLLGDAETARQHAEQALERATDPRQPLVLIATHRVLGELAMQDKRFVEAEEHLQASLNLAEACAAPYEQAQTLLALADLNAVTGKPDEAWKQLDRVRAICTPLEATPTLRRATDIGAKLSVRRGQQVHPAGLTPREVEVLQHVALGMTNAEAGDALFISSRTVAQHLRSIYNKLGVDSRVAATRFAVEHGLVDSPSDYPA